MVECVKNSQSSNMGQTLCCLYSLEFHFHLSVLSAFGCQNPILLVKILLCLNEVKTESLDLENK